jgi:hypothetical protein
MSPTSRLSLSVVAALLCSCPWLDMGDDRDAGPSQTDASPSPDGGQPADSGKPTSDAGMAADSALAGQDAGEPGPDAEASDAGEPDAGTPATDAGESDAGHPSTDGGDLNPDASVAYLAPYTLTAFRGAIGKAKLQTPDSNTAVFMPALMTYASPSFHLAADDPTKVEFGQMGSSMRTELRDLEEWQTSTSTARTLSARLALTYVSPELGQFTFLQIHDAGTTPDKPLLRMAWLRSRNAIEQHIWSIVRTSVLSDTYSYTDLGAVGSDYFDVSISVLSNTLTITLNGVVVVGADVSYWETLNSYFKAGVYLQTTGEARDRFDALTW